MSKKIMNSDLDEFFNEDTQWKNAFIKLREIFKSFNLKEELKWGKPCYTLNDSNIALIHGFKDYCAVLFINGASMRDPSGIFVQQTKNVQTGRQIRFTDLSEIINAEAIIKEYISEAIRVEKYGEKVKFKKTDEYEIPDELEAAFSSDPALREAFYALTPGRQRGYLLHFSSAKQSATRAARIDKAKPAIFDGLGLNDFSKGKIMPTSNNTDDTAAVIEKITAMKSPFREMGQRLHALILETDPTLCPRVWYGMPGYAKSQSSPVVCYFRADRYMTFGLTEKARFDFGQAPHGMCETAWFMEELSPEAEKKIAEIIRESVG